MKPEKKKPVKPASKKIKTSLDEHDHDDDAFIQEDPFSNEPGIEELSDDLYDDEDEEDE